MGIRPLAIALFLAAVLAFGCDNEFSPKTTFEPRIAVFAVLNAEADMQVVRLAWSYDGTISTPPVPLTQREIDSAVVRIREGGTMFTFRDTVLTLDDGRKEHSWISRELRPKAEMVYTLSISIPGQEPITAELTSPSRPYCSAERVDADTGLGWVRVHTGLVAPRVPAGGFHFRAWLATTHRINGVAVTRRVEVPLRKDPTSGSWVYPIPQKASYLVFDSNVLKVIADSLKAFGDSVITERVYARCYVMDQKFYNYYKIVRGFDDPVSMRLDDPDISYINGGLGVFGTLLADSSNYPLSRFLK